MAKKYSYNNLEDMKMLGEPLLTLLSSMAAEPVSGYAGMFTGDADTVESVQDMLTYEPRTESGKKGMQHLGKGVQSAMDMIGADDMSGYWKDRVVPSLQEELGTKGGAATAAGLAAIASVGMPGKANKIVDISELARQRRGKDMGYTDDVFHYSQSTNQGDPFESFDPDRKSLYDLGTHVGTEAQAQERFKGVNSLNLGKIEDMPEYDREHMTERSRHMTMPLKARLGKSLRLEDIMDWGDPSRIFNTLLDEGDINFKPESMDRIREARDIYKEWNDGPGYNFKSQREAIVEIRDIIKSEGYDSVIYSNKAEVPVDKMIPDEAEWQLVNEQKAMEIEIERTEKRKVGKSLQSVKDDQLRRQRAKLNEIKQKLKDTDSYIILDPKDVKSRNAKFMNEDNLMSFYGTTDQSQQVA